MAEGGAALPPPADPRAGLFDIVIDFAGPWSAAFQPAFLQAAARIEALVLGDLPDIAVPSPGGGPLAVVDDLVIRAELPAMDGPGGMLGGATVTSVRPGSLLPATSSMRFDAADAGFLLAGGTWDDTVLHEMLHGLGFGVLWAAKGLVAPGGGSYVGPAGAAQYAAMGGAGPVPVETLGGPGTAGAHWSKAALGAELMTGWLGEAGGVLTSLTVASLADLGYGLAPPAAWAADAAFA
jgi:hypothetical protein